jgi:integrase
VLSGILGLGVRDRRLPASPAVGLSLPRAHERARRYLSAAQVAALADAAGRFRLAVLVLAYCGLRWSELAALRVCRVDLMRCRLDIAEAMTEVNGGTLVWGTPKSHEARSVPIPRFLADDLMTHLAGKSSDGLVFTTVNGAPLRNRGARRAWFDRAAAETGVAGLTPHELRHTAASLAVSAGANVKAVQRMLGHASAALTLDRYADLFDDDLDAVAERLDAVARAASVAPALPSGQIVDLAAARQTATAQ